MWLNKLLRDIPSGTPQVINDSKTPSGRVHVGSLRGVLIHDAMARALKAHDTPAHFMYGVDDYDPMDGLPADAGDELRRHMGEPLCAVAGEPNFATRYITEFLDLFEPLGISADIYYTSNMYRRGDFNEAIETFLNATELVREIYAQIGGKRMADNFPFQVICERCGKIGTTRVTHWDGKQVTYRCEPQLVKWANGCGYEGQASPFDGRGKLPWKLEWPAKWQRFGVTIEGAGKDHCTKGGARDIAEACARRVLNIEPPLNIPYEFFLVDGTKMSSSRGIGTAARDMADFLPPGMLRFLMLRSPPHKTVNFSTRADYTARLFNEYDELTQRALAANAPAEKKQLLRLASPTNDLPTLTLPPFQLLSALAQLPHIDIESEIERRFPDTYTAADREQLSARIRAARYWLEHFADDEKTALCTKLPASAESLSATQKAFLHLLAKKMPTSENNASESESRLQSLVFEVARTTPLSPKKAFEAIYCVLFDSDQGPRAGAVLAWLNRDFLLKRFTEARFAVPDWWRETAVASDEALQRLDEAETERVVKIELRHDDETEMRVLNILAERRDQKCFAVRVQLEARTTDDALNESTATLTAIRSRYPQTPDIVTREDALLA